MRHLLQIPQDVLLRWYSEACPGTSECKTLFMLGEDAGSCLRVISNDGNKYNRALMGYVLQSHVRALVVVDTVGPRDGAIAHPAGAALGHAHARHLLRPDVLHPRLLARAAARAISAGAQLAEHMGASRARVSHVLPLVGTPHIGRRSRGAHAGSRASFHAGSPSPRCPPRPSAVAATRAPTLGAYTRRVTELDYDIEWVDLLEMDGVAPYTYSEELPYDALLQQHTPGVLGRTPGAEEREARRLVIASAAEGGLADGGAVRARARGRDGVDDAHQGGRPDARAARAGARADGAEGAHALHRRPERRARPTGARSISRCPSSTMRSPSTSCPRATCRRNWTSEVIDVNTC